VKLHGQGTRNKQLPKVSTLELIAARMSSGAAGTSKSAGASKSASTSKSAKSAGTSKPVGSSKHSGHSHKRNDVRDRQTSHKDSTHRDKPRVLSHAVRRAQAVWGDEGENTNEEDHSEDEEDEDEDDQRRSPRSRKSGSRKSGKRNQHEEAKTPRREVAIYDYRTASQITKQSPHARKMKGQAKRWYRFWILVTNAFPDKHLQLKKIKECWELTTDMFPEHYAVSQ
jgi:hypothetical protein